jgi:hypothetical protein
MKTTPSHPSLAVDPQPSLSKRPYERPAILFREPLEAVAAACTPTPPGKADLVQCQSPQS